MTRAAIDAFKRRLRTLGVPVRPIIMEASDQHGVIKVEVGARGIRNKSPALFQRLLKKLMGHAADVAREHQLQHDVVEGSFVFRFRRPPEPRSGMA